MILFILQIKLTWCKKFRHLVIIIFQEDKLNFRVRIMVMVSIILRNIDPKPFHSALSSPTSILQHLTGEFH